jgi:4-hydroxy-tetrahydrodipicolinate synthase
MNTTPSFGLSAALVTPFDADGRPDLPRLCAHARRVLDGGCDGVTLFGTTGEGFGLSLRDRAEMLGAIAGSGIAMGARVHAGVSATVPADAADQAACALDAGVRGLLFAPPFYFKDVDDEGLYAWFSRAFERIGPALRGVILYHIPGQTAVPLSVALVDRLRQAFPGVVTGVKDSACDWETTRRFLDAHGDLEILVGDERLLARAVRAGAQGSICGLANLVPGLLRPLIDAGRDDARVARLVAAIGAYPPLSAVKALVGHLAGGDPGFGAMRPPLRALGAADRQALARAFDAIVAGEPAGAPA